MPDYFHDKVCWITGANSGIGEALTYNLAAQGAKLAISARRTELLEAVKAKCPSPENIMVVHLDLTDSEHFPELARRIHHQFGQIDYLFNNGGVSQRSNASETLMEVDRRIMEVNYFGNIALTKAVLPYMLERKSGHIVVLSSVAGRYGFYLRSSYSASKHALHGFYEALQFEEMDNGLKVTLVCPGFVKTNMAPNALKGDGKLHEHKDRNQNNGMLPEEAARRILKATRKGKKLYMTGGKEVFAVYIKRFWPNLWWFLMKGQSPTG